MYSDIFCKVYNEFGWNYYPEAFGRQLLQWLQRRQAPVKTCLDLGCGTGILCALLHENGIAAEGMDFSSGMIGIARENNPGIPFEVGDMVTYCPEKSYDLVTCTGDALNHIGRLSDVERIFRNVYGYLNLGGYFVFDILNENEVSSDDPFEMDFDERTRVWFQMTRPGDRQVNLRIRVFEEGQLRLEENIRETVHDPAIICDLLERAGFSNVRCSDRLPEDGDNHGTTWFVIGEKH